MRNYILISPGNKRVKLPRQAAGIFSYAHGEVKVKVSCLKTPQENP